MMTIRPAHVITMTSRCFIWLSSWPSTASSSGRESRDISPLVTATTELFGLRPVANALGTWVSMTAIFFGLGMSAIAASRSTMPCSSGSSCAVTTLAPVVISTSRSEP